MALPSPNCNSTRTVRCKVVTAFRTIARAHYESESGALLKNLCDGIAV
jgi:hypothetical protein